MRSINVFENKHRGETAFILGNGPSLKDIDIEELKTRGVVFGTNRIYLKGAPHYYVCVNPLVMKQFAEEIERHPNMRRVWAKFMPSGEIELDTTDFPDQPRRLHIGDVYNIDVSEQMPSFQPHMVLPMWEGYSVTYVAIQLAYQMGFSTVVLVGVDHDYGKVEEKWGSGVEVSFKSEDPYHFDPKYFKNKKWHTPNLAMSELGYAYARRFFDVTGRVILNCSAHTKLDIFEKMPLQAYLDNNRPVVSAIVSAYYADEFLEGCLVDLDDQTLYALEIVVVCKEGSKEHEIALEYKEWGQKWLKIVTTDDVPNVYEAWNLGIKAASGRYLTNANADDRHHARAYQIMADTLDGMPGVDLVYHNSYITWERNETYEQFTDGLTSDVLALGREEGEPGVFVWGAYSRERLSQGCFIGPHPMWRATLHQKYGYFQPDLPSAGDYEFWLRIAKADNMYNIPMVLGLYLARPDGVELSDLEASAIQSVNAQVLTQAQTASIIPLGDRVRINVGDNWVYITKAAWNELNKGVQDA